MVNKLVPGHTATLEKQTENKFKMAQCDKCYEGNERGMAETKGTHQYQVPFFCPSPDAGLSGGGGRHTVDNRTSAMR